jgi:hypothetical protein
MYKNILTFLAEEMQYVSLYVIYDADHAKSLKKSFDWLQFPRKIMKHVKYALHTTSMTQCVLTALP